MTKKPRHKQSRRINNRSIEAQLNGAENAVAALWRIVTTPSHLKATKDTPMDQRTQLRSFFIAATDLAHDIGPGFHTVSAHGSRAPVEKLGYVLAYHLHHRATPYGRKAILHAAGAHRAAKREGIEVVESIHPLDLHDLAQRPDIGFIVTTADRDLTRDIPAGMCVIRVVERPALGGEFAAVEGGGDLGFMRFERVAK